MQVKTLVRSYNYLTIFNGQPVFYRKTAEDVRQEPVYVDKMARIARPVLIITMAILLPLLVAMQLWKWIGG